MKCLANQQWNAYHTHNEMSHKQTMKCLTKCLPHEQWNVSQTNNEMSHKMPSTQMMKCGLNVERFSLAITRISSVWLTAGFYCCHWWTANGTGSGLSHAHVPRPSHGNCLDTILQLLNGTGSSLSHGQAMAAVQTRFFNCWMGQGQACPMSQGRAMTVV